MLDTTVCWSWQGQIWWKVDGDNKWQYISHFPASGALRGPSTINATGDWRSKGLTRILRRVISLILKQRINKNPWTSYRLNFTTWLSLKSCVLTTVGSWIQVKRVFTINQESVCCPNFCTMYSLKHIQKCFAEALHWSSFNSVLAPKGTLCITMTPVKLLLIRSAPAKSHNSTQLLSSTGMSLRYLALHQMRCCM